MTAVKRGRPSTSIRFPAELRARLSRLAESRDTSMNRLIVQAVREFVEREGRA